MRIPAELTETNVQPEQTETVEFIRQLFAVLVDGPAFLTLAERQLRASTIACAVVDTHGPAIHLAYNEVRRERRAAGLPMGS